MAKDNKIQLSQEQEELSREIVFSDADWQTITEADLLDYSLGDEPYPLPKEALKKQNSREFAFRWIENSPSRLKEIMRQEVPEKWWPCNRTNTPFLSKLCDIDGAVHCKDQILVFKPWWMHQKRQEAVEGSTEASLRSKSLEGKAGFVENDGSEWATGERVRISDRDEIMGEVSDGI